MVENHENDGKSGKQGHARVQDAGMFDKWTEAITFAEAGQPEIAKEILGLNPALSGRIYGNIVYWGTLVAAVIAMLGLVISFDTRNYYIAPSYLLGAIWQQKSVAEIWQGAVGALPQGHWYLSHLDSGDGLTEAGIALAVFLVIPAILASAFILFKKKSMLYGTLALITAMIMICSMFGLIPLPIS